MSRIARCEGRGAYHRHTIVGAAMQTARHLMDVFFTIHALCIKSLAKHFQGRPRPDAQPTAAYFLLGERVRTPVPFKWPDHRIIPIHSTPSLCCGSRSPHSNTIGPGDDQASTSLQFHPQPIYGHHGTSKRQHQPKGAHYLPHLPYLEPRRLTSQRTDHHGPVSSLHNGFCAVCVSLAKAHQSSNQTSVQSGVLTERPSWTRSSIQSAKVNRVRIDAEVLT